MKTDQTHIPTIKPPDSDGARLQHLVTQLSWAGHRYLSRRLEQFELTLPQWITLRALAHLTRPGCTLNELSEASHQVPATMTGIINRLVQRQLVDRQRDPNNRRALRLSLTPKGQQLMIEIESQQNHLFDDMLAEFTLQEQQVLLHMMNSYLEHILEEIDPKKLIRQEEASGK